MEPRLPLETTNEPTYLLPMGTLLAYNPMATIQSPMIRATPRMEPRLPLEIQQEGHLNTTDIQLGVHLSIADLHL